MRKAVIDMGTNTFNLLIADVDQGLFKSVHATKEPVLLGMGGINDNLISDDAMARAFLALQKFVRICDSLRIDRSNIVAIGTSALRGATNSPIFTTRVEKEFGFEVNIISGEEEAQYIYQGVKWNHDFSDTAVIMDIGGGSTEFIRADQSGPTDVLSLDIGVSRVYQQFNFPETYSSELQQSIFNYFDECGQNRMENVRAETLIGASGSFETFFEMIFQREWRVENGVMELPMNELMKILNWSIQSTQKERNEHVWITHIRKTMLPIGALQVIWALKNTSASRVLISPYSLKEGALY